MSKKTTARKWRLYDGVGFDPNKAYNREWSPAMHWAVLAQSLHSGSHVFGPFLSEDAAHAWLREDGRDGYFYEHFGRCSSMEGVAFYVTYMEAPAKRD